MIIKESLKIKNLLIHNRIVMPPMASKKTEDGRITPAHLRYYTKRCGSGGIGLVITEQDSSTVDVTLSGARRVLSKLNNSNVTATVDLSNVYTDARYSVTYNLSFPGGISDADIKLVRRSVDATAMRPLSR